MAPRPLQPHGSTTHRDFPHRQVPSPLPCLAWQWLKFYACRQVVRGTRVAGMSVSVARAGWDQGPHTKHTRAAAISGVQILPKLRRAARREAG